MKGEQTTGIAQQDKGKRLFQKFAIATCISIFILVILGGTVRITGSGMGCPDWPACYGRLIPPTDAAQLSDKYDKASFNALKTWTEYINRTFTGVVSIAAIGMLITSLAWWGSDKVFTALGLSVILLIAFEAWLGAVVVKTNLNNYKITIHLAAAMFIFAISILAVVRTQKYDAPGSHAPMWLAGLAAVTLLIVLVQILMGTMVRTEMDQIAQDMNGTHRDMWIDQAQQWLPVHRKFSYLAAAVAGALSFITLRLNSLDRSLKINAVVLLAATAGQMLAGIILKNNDFPALAQLLHLVLAMVMFGSLVYGLTWTMTRVQTISLNPAHADIV